MKSFLTLLIVVVIFSGVSYAGYQLFAGKSATAAGTNTGLVDSAPVVQNNAPIDSIAIGQDFLGLLLGIQSIRLDDSLFTSKAFNVLQDFNRPIPPDTNPGRNNPFAPIGQDGLVVSNQVSTSGPSAITSSSATLNGTLTVSGPSVTRWFEYGTTPELGTMTGPKQQPTGGAFAEIVKGLLSNTTYYVKASASVDNATVTGKMITFKTAPASAR